MNIMIDIECTTINDLLSHLQCLKEQVRKQAKINKADIMRDDFAEGTMLNDNNCYGTHELNVIEVIKSKG